MTKAMTRASKCKAPAIRTAEVMENEVVEGGRAAEDTAGDAAAWEAVKVMRSARRCTNS